MNKYPRFGEDRTDDERKQDLVIRAMDDYIKAVVEDMRSDWPTGIDHKRVLAAQIIEALK